MPWVKRLIRKPGLSTGVVNGKRQNPNGNFHTGFAVPFTVVKRSNPKGLELVRKSEWNAQLFPFGNSVWEFWSTFQETPFSPEIFHLGRLISSFHLHSNRNFRIFFVNGKQPLTHSSHSILKDILRLSHPGNLFWARPPSDPLLAPNSRIGVTNNFSFLLDSVLRFVVENVSISKFLRCITLK